MEAAAEDSPRRALSTTQLYRFEHIKGEIVEQPSAQIWVLAFNAVSSAMSYISPDSNTDRVFNNADSFAMVFDATWRKLTEKNKLIE